MKKVLTSLSVLLVVLSFTQCGPAAEDRNVMYANAKRTRDSIGKDIDDQLAKALFPEPLRLHQLQLIRQKLNNFLKINLYVK